MISIVAWSNVVPWAEPRQVEQDLIISRAIIDLFSDSFLREQLRFRGGTTLNKLHFPAPIRFSEDIDLVRTTSGPIGPILNGVRERLEPWLGRANFNQSPVAPKLRFRAQAEDPAASAQIRLKIEINTAETETYDAIKDLSDEVEQESLRLCAILHTTPDHLFRRLLMLPENGSGRTSPSNGSEFQSPVPDPPSAIPTYSGGLRTREGIVLQNGLTLRKRYKGQEYTAVVENDFIRVSGVAKSFTSPSLAAVAIAKHQINGWSWWEYFDKKLDAWKTLDELRKKGVP